MAATFQITDSFYLTGRGLVAVGTIITGTINTGNRTVITISGRCYQVRIKGIEYVDLVGLGESYVGLILESENSVELPRTKLASQTIDLLAPEE